MTDLTLEEFRGMAPEHELAAKLRQDAFLISGPHTHPPKRDRGSEPKRKSLFSTWAGRLLPLSFRASH